MTPVSQNAKEVAEISGHWDKIERYAEQIAKYSREYHTSRPDIPLRYCIEMGAGRFMTENGSEQSGVAQMAMAEMAARWVFSR